MTTITESRQATSDARTRPTRHRRALLRALLICGVLSSPLYIGMDLFTALRYEGYSYVDQWVSELSAVDAPTRSLWLAIGPVYQLLMTLFGVSVWIAAGRRRALRTAAVLVIAYGLVGFTAPFTPMHGRAFLAEHGPTLTDRLHLVNTAVAVLLIFATIGFAAAAFGARFRIYSAATVLLSLFFGAWTSKMAPRIEADLPTPWGGVIERVSMALFMVWVVVFALALLRRTRSTERTR
jgi:hypothetical protein